MSGVLGCAGPVGPCPRRRVRDTDGGLWIVPRRSRCTGCGVTHVLLPVVLLVRRADTAAVIGAGLTAKATGAGHRLIAALLGRPRGDGAGLAAAFRRPGRAGPRGVHPLVPGAGPGSGAARAGRVGVGRRHRRDRLAAAAAVGARFGIGEVPVWQVATAISAARLLLPGWPAPAGRG